MVEDFPAEPGEPQVFTGEYSYPMGLSKPVIAAVNGVAAGLGLSYMLFYDMRIASDRARFATVFAHRGWWPNMAVRGCFHVWLVRPTPAICSSRDAWSARKKRCAWDW